MKTADLLQRLNLKIMAKNARIRDLEAENAELKRSLDYNIVALGKADAKIIELSKDSEK